MTTPSFNIMADNFAFDADSYFWRTLRDVGMPKWRNVTVRALAQPHAWDMIDWYDCRGHAMAKLARTGGWWQVFISGGSDGGDVHYIRLGLSADIIARLRECVEDPTRT